jgi:photosystem II stability/assembly factor-like uncharacterized protein
VNNGENCGLIWSLAINSQDHIFAGTAGCGQGVYRSTNNGDSWELTNTGLTSTDVAALAINAADGYIFAGTFSQFGEGGGIFRSTDNGDTWTEQNSGFTAFDVNALAINSSGHVFAGAAGGAFRSTDDGDNWSDISSGLIPLGGNVWALAIDTGGYALAGTAGGGVFRSVESTTTGEIRLRFNAHERAGTKVVRLAWVHATSATVDIYRNGALLVTVNNDGSYVDVLTVRGIYTYQVCEAGTQNCSNEVIVRFRGPPLP